MPRLQNNANANSEEEEAKKNDQFLSIAVLYKHKRMVKSKHAKLCLLRRHPGVGGIDSFSV